MGEAGPDRDDEDEAMTFVRLAGARPVPSRERTAAARAHFDAAWRSERRGRRARTRLLQLAAALAAAVALVVVGRRATGPPPAALPLGSAHPQVVVARLDAALGPVEHETSTGWATLEVGARLLSGARVRTGPGGAGLRVEDGRSVRVAPESRLRWEAPGTLTLESGAVYVDSGGSGRAGSAFEVRTARGAVRETGTQFEVRLESAALRVRVREGRVAVAPRDSLLEAGEGTEIRIDDVGGASRRSILPYGPEWSWALSLAPSFEMDGRSPHEFLAWAARESGFELRYAGADARRRAETARLRGSIHGVRPDSAVSAVLPATGLRHRLEAGVLHVESDSGADAR